MIYLAYSYTACGFAYEILRPLKLKDNHAKLKTYSWMYLIFLCEILYNLKQN